LKVGDSIGGIYKRQKPDGKEEWYLSESKITRIVQNSRGTKVYSKRFFPIEIEEIEDSTKLMLDANGWIITREVVLLTPEIREKCNRWIKWANDNPDKAVGLISGA
jgi:hypothetical protein